MARQGPNVSGIVADATLLAWVRRFLKTKAAIETVYAKAGEFASEGRTGVTFVSGNLDGGGVAGQLMADPLEMMGACEVALQEIEAENGCGISPSRSGSTHFNFSTRRVGT